MTKKNLKTEWLAKEFPLWFRVIKGNPYGLPIGKILRGRYKTGTASPFPVELYGDHQLYQMKLEELEEIKKGGTP